MKPYLSVIIPAYNEAKRLPATLVDLDKYFKNVGNSMKHCPAQVSLF